MAGLLVSVRSAGEAAAAVEGGASVVDVKEPKRGPLGRAEVSVWRAVRRVVPGGIPVSVALGELGEWVPGEAAQAASADFAGITYRKVGLARADRDWPGAWSDLRRRLGPGPRWVAVAYADWAPAGAPRPDDVLDVALGVEGCAAILVDTWDKTRANPLDDSWGPWFDRARAGGLLTALAGRLEERQIARLASLAPDLYAVRGAACRRGDRCGTIDPARVSALAHLVASLAPVASETGRVPTRHAELARNPNAGD